MTDMPTLDCTTHACRLDLPYVSTEAYGKAIAEFDRLWNGHNDDATLRMERLLALINAYENTAANRQV